MLVLTRLLDETIVIGSGITVTILAVNGSQVRLGIDAPKHIRVLREELVEQDAARRGVTPGVQARNRTEHALARLVGCLSGLRCLPGGGVKERVNVG